MVRLNISGAEPVLRRLFHMEQQRMSLLTLLLKVSIMN